MSQESSNLKLLSNLISYLEEKKKLTDYKHLIDKKNKLTLKKNHCILSLNNSLYKKVKDSEKDIRNFLFSELNKDFNIFFEVLKDNVELELKNQLEAELREFKSQSKFDFYIDNPDNYLVTSKLKEFLINSDTSVLLIGSKGSGKSYLIKEILKDTEYTYLNLKTFQEKLFSFKTNKKAFISSFKDHKLIVFDHLESISKNSDSYKLLSQIRDSRKETRNKNIFILSTKKVEQQDQLITDNLLIFPPPTQKFVLQLTKELLKRHHPELKITESAIEFLSYLLGNNLKELINKLFKFFIFLESYSYQTNILDKEELKNIFNDLFNKTEKKSLINYEQNSQLKALCDKKGFNLETVKGNSKTKKSVFEKDQIIHILRERFNFSVKDISRILSKSKSSIHYSLNKIKNKRESETFKNYFDYLTKI